MMLELSLQPFVPDKHVRNKITAIFRICVNVGQICDTSQESSMHEYYYYLRP